MSAVFRATPFGLRNFSPRTSSGWMLIFCSSSGELDYLRVFGGKLLPPVLGDEVAGEDDLVPLPVRRPSSPIRHGPMVSSCVWQRCQTHRNVERHDRLVTGAPQAATMAIVVRLAVDKFATARRRRKWEQIILAQDLAYRAGVPY